jgi:ATP-dependent helicase HrpB
LRISILTGFPDRVAKKREGGEALLASGGSARMDEAALAASGVADLFVALEIQDRQGIRRTGGSLQSAKAPERTRTLPSVESLVPIEPEWLFDLDPPGVEEQDEVLWDPERKRVTALARLKYGQLILSESPAKSAGEAGTRLLCKMALGLDLERLAELSPSDFVNATTLVTDAEAFESMLSRTLLLHQNCPGMPAPGGAVLAETLKTMLMDKTSLAELQAMSWPDEVVQALEIMHPGYSHELAKWMPTHFQFPNGRRARIHYRLGQPAWIESRLQDFFGLKQGPSIAGSRIALTLHLLAPNQRAVQVTRDLPGFWERVYPEIRGELSRRYPRHAWPEDPRREA